MSFFFLEQVPCGNEKKNDITEINVKTSHRLVSSQVEDKVLAMVSRYH